MFITQHKKKMFIRYAWSSKEASFPLLPYHNHYISHYFIFYFLIPDQKISRHWQSSTRPLPLCLDGGGWGERGEEKGRWLECIKFLVYLDNLPPTLLSSHLLSLYLLPLVRNLLICIILSPIATFIENTFQNQKTKTWRYRYKYFIAHICTHKLEGASHWVALYSRSLTVCVVHVCWIVNDQDQIEY